MRLLPALALLLGVVLGAPAHAQDAAKAGAGGPRQPGARQVLLLQQQITALPPQREGVTDVYALGVAAFGAQSVFRNELEGALAATGKALPLAGSVRLINNRETAKSIPLATQRNFRSAVRAIGQVMNKEEDVLFLFMTSHGTRQGIVLELPGSFRWLSPQEVAAALDREGIRNRVVIVSACYSGIFVKPLANENSIVVTAADEKNTSFGCADGRDWTYFGDALFQQSLKPGVALAAAFAKARALITSWEKRDRFRPSNPQGHFGLSLVHRLAPLVETAGAAPR